MSHEKMNENKMSESQLLELIAHASNIRRITPAMRSLLSIVGQRAVYEAGQSLFAKDSSARLAYVVLEGVVEVGVEELCGTRAIRHAWPGDILRGTIPDIDAARPVTATARTRVEALRLPIGAFPTFAHPGPRTGIPKTYAS